MTREASSGAGSSVGTASSIRKGPEPSLLRDSRQAPIPSFSPRSLASAARANKLYQLFRQHQSLDEIAPRTSATIEESYFKRPIEQVWEETRQHYLDCGRPGEVDKAESNPRHRMALVFEWPEV